MAIEVTIPRLGWSMDEGEFGEWLKADGAFVQAGEAIFTLESDKALQEVESLDSGILRILPNGPRPGDTVSVGALVAFLTEEGEAVPARPRQTPAAVKSAAIPTTGEQVFDRKPAAGEETSSPRPASEPPSISPRAARLAKQLGVDWTALRGGGTTGRIREQDVRAAAAPAPGVAVNSVDRRPTGGLRRTIAERMMHSVRNTAPVTLTSRVDATNLVSLREQFQRTRPDSVPACHDIVALLAALTLPSHPEMQRQWRDGEVVEPKGVHIGLAVDTEAGLLVPVIRNCDQLSLGELTRQSRELVERARARRCTAEELSGGTFSITNLGAFGIDAFTPIINTPETAILGLGAIRREAVVLEDERIVPGWRMILSLTFDHRLTDGAPAARFLKSLCAGVENPGPLLIG